MLREARQTGLEVRRDGHALIVRGSDELGGLAREILSHKALVLAALERESEYRGHERAQHDGEGLTGGRVAMAASSAPRANWR